MPLRHSIFTWQNGRQLATASNGTNTISYQCNDSGIRTRKTVNGVTTDYYLNGSNIVTEIRGSDRLDYYYDEQGNLFGFKVNNASEYYYIRNGQNDIIGILDSTGAQVVSYSYDTWGKLVSVTETLASTIGAVNPFRYRGYYYDSETSLYYLNSRYYDANMGRFINADGVVGASTDLSSFNMFSYCGNNPVSRMDPSGLFWEEIWDFFKGIVDVVVNIVVTVIDALNDTIIEPIVNVSSGIIGLLNFNDVAKMTQENKRIHTENVVNAGVNQYFEPKPFVGEKEKQAEGYKERCIEQNKLLRIDTDNIMKVDIEGKEWKDLTKGMQDRLVSDMLVWDRDAYYAFNRKALSDLVIIGWDIVY